MDERYFRPTEVNYLLADIGKAKKELKWKPSVYFDDLVRIMVDYDLMDSKLEYPGVGVRICKTKEFGFSLINTRKNDQS